MDENAKTPMLGREVGKRQAIKFLAGAAVLPPAFAASASAGGTAAVAGGSASLPPPIFPDVASGMSAVEPGRMFATSGGESFYAVLYQSLGDHAAERARYVTAAEFVQDAASSLYTYRAPFPGAQARSLAEKLSDAPLNVLDFGVSENKSAADNHLAFNRAIAAGNRSHKLLYVPAGTYANAGALDTIVGPGMYGDAAGGAAIHHMTPDSCVVTRGSYIQLSNITVINKSAAGAGKVDAACFHIINCAYGRFTGLYAAHDLDQYAGILLEQRYDGSADDAAFLAHLGCWYNYFLACAANYASLGASRGYGIRFRVAPKAMGVVDPPGQAPGKYSGQCSYNIIDLANIEQRVEGLRIERGACNQVRGGQFLGGDIQIRLIDSSANLFIGTRHNQWRRAIFVEEGGSDRNVILYPSLFQTGPQPWSLGRLSANSIAVRADQQGSWTPRLTFGGLDVSTSRATGSFSNVAGLVTINWDIRLADASAGGLMEISGLPFPALNDPARGLAICDLFILDHGKEPLVPSGRVGHGYCGSLTITAFADHSQDLAGKHFGKGAIILGKMTYFTDWT